MSLAAAGTQEISGIRPWRKFEGHTNWVTDVIHLPGEQQIMTSSYDHSLRVWNLQSGKQIEDHWGDGGSRIALSPDGRKVVSEGPIGGLKLWDPKTSKVIAEWTELTDYVTSVCWSRDGGRVVSGSNDRTARVWDVESGKTVLAIETGLRKVEAVIYSPDMTMIATGGNSKDSKEFIKIWDAKTGKLITNLKGHTEDVCCLAWTADGSMLISGSMDDSIRTWNTTTWQQIHVLTGHTFAVRGIAISPNGPILASASWDNTAQLWNLENGQPIGLPLQHPDHVRCVSFSTNGKLLATGCWDNNAYSWDISGILDKAGLLNPIHLSLSNEHAQDGDKLIDADATRRPGHRRKDVHRIPPKFFDDSPHHPQPSRTHHLSPSSSGQHQITVHPSPHRRTHLDNFFSLFHRNNYNTHDAPPRLHFLEWVRSTFVHLPRGRNDEGVELQDRRLEVVDVPFTRGKPMNYSVGELRRKEEKEKQKAMQAKNAQDRGNTTNASGAAQAQPTSQVHVATSTLSTTPAVATTSAVTTTTSRPDAMIPRAGPWTRFRLSICCVSAQYTDVQ